MVFRNFNRRTSRGRSRGTRLLWRIPATVVAFFYETELLRVHVKACVDEGLREGTIGEKREKIVELVDLLRAGALSTRQPAIPVVRQGAPR